MPHRRLPTPASDAPRLLRDRAAHFLEAQDRAVSSALLAREVLGVRHGSESVCDAILAPTLGGDPRFARTREGRWVLGEPAHTAAAPAPTALRDRVWSVWAVESEGRAAAALRLEAGRIVAERAEPPGEVEGAGTVAKLSPAGRRRLIALGAGTLATSWERAGLVETVIAPRASMSYGERACREIPGSRPLESFIPLPALARVALGPPRPRSLEKLAASLGIAYVDAATPLARARLTAECLMCLLESERLRDRSEQGLRALLEARIAPHPALEDPEGALRRQLDALPSEPGVYRFFDKEGRLLYVGKARDLRRRVGSYFAPRAHPDARTAAWLGSVERIEHDRSGSELEALLREASQIAARAPARNRQRAVHARRGRAIGDLVLVQRAERSSAVRVALVKNGALAARLVLGPRGGGRERLRSLVEELYFLGRAFPGPSKSLRGARNEAASRALLLSWLRRQPQGPPPLDPTDDPGPAEACARILAAASALRRGETDVMFRLGSTSKQE